MRQAPDKEGLLAALDREPFQAPAWLRWRHGQTAWSPVFRRQETPQATQEYWPTPDGDRLSVWIQRGLGDHPWALLLHGLEGCASSNYIVGLRVGFAALGWNVAIMEFRSCDGTMNSAPRLYHSGETTDLEFAIGELERRHAVQELVLAGFSLGANVIGKWLGERGDAVPAAVVAAALVSPPFDLTISGPHIDRAFGGLYVRRFLGTLIPKGIAKARQFPNLLNEQKIRDSRTFEDFDTWATAALHGFEDAWDYWRKVGCGQFLPHVRVPTLIVASADDPFNPVESMPVAACEDSPWLVPRFTEAGGHVGFVHGVPWRTRHWAEEQVVAFAALLAPARQSRYLE